MVTTVDTFKQISNWEGSKKLAAVYEDGEEIEISFKKHYFSVSKPIANNFGKTQMQFKSERMSQELKKYVKQINEQINGEIRPFINNDGVINVNITNKTMMYDEDRKQISELPASDKMDVFVILTISSVFHDEDKDFYTAPINAKTVFVIKTYSDIDDVDVSKLSLAK